MHSRSHGPDRRRRSIHRGSGGRCARTLFAETRTGKEFGPSPVCAIDACCLSTTRLRDVARIVALMPPTDPRHRERSPPRLFVGCPKPRSMPIERAPWSARPGGRGGWGSAAHVYATWRGIAARAAKPSAPCPAPWTPIAAAPDERVAQLVEDFLDSLISPRTRASYATDLAIFLVWLARRRAPARGPAAARRPLPQPPDRAGRPRRPAVPLRPPALCPLHRLTPPVGGPLVLRLPRRPARARRLAGRRRAHAARDQGATRQGAQPQSSCVACSTRRRRRVRMPRRSSACSHSTACA